MLGRAASRIAALIPALLLLVLWTGPARAESGRFDLLADACAAAGAQDAGVSPSYVRQLDYHCRGEEPHRGDRDRKCVVEGTLVSVRVDLGGRRIIKKKKEYNYDTND